jgi:uncharacterized integral membrane protein
MAKDESDVEPEELPTKEEPAEPGSDAVAEDGSSEPAAGETKRERTRRHAARTRLQVNSVAGVVLLAFLVALAALNTRKVKADWVFGTSRVGLVWLVLFAAILGWLLGVLSIAAFHWRTRRRQH